MFQNILLPTDGSDYSRTALQYGITIAKKLDARLTGSPCHRYQGAPGTRPQ